MPFQAQTYRVLIASPGDVREERDALRDIVGYWSADHAEAEGVAFLPLRWEEHSRPEAGDRPQAIINRQVLDRADVLVAIFWTRLGTPTGEYASGTVEEIERSITSGKHVLLYFSRRHVDPHGFDRVEFERVKKFQREVQPRVLFGEFQNIDDLRTNVSRHLLHLARDIRRSGFDRGESFAHAALGTLHALDVLLVQMLVGWDSYEVIELNEDRTKDWAEVFEAHVADLQLALSSRLPPELLRHHLATVLTEVRRVSRSFDRGIAEEQSDFAESARRLTEAYRKLNEFSLNNGIRLMPSPQ